MERVKKKKIVFAIIVGVFRILFNLILGICLCYFFIAVTDKGVYFEGLDNVGEGGSSVGLNNGNKKFFNELKQFDYIEGNYYYYDQFVKSEKVVLYLKFKEEDYLKAKEYLFDNFNMLENSIKEFNDYVFYLNKDFIDDNKQPETNKYYDYWYYGFPDLFQAYCYNDKCHILMMLGYSVDALYKELGLAKDEFGKFLETAFGKYYDFNQ